MRRIAIAAGVVALLLAGPASSQVDNDVQERLRFLEERLDASKKHGEYWTYGWLTIMGGGLIANTTQAILDDDRTNHIVNATKSVVGLTYFYLDPMEARLGADPIRAMPGGTPTEREAQLAAAEKLLQGNANRSARRTDWKMYAGNLAFHGIGLGISLAWGDKSDAWIDFGAGAAMGALQFATAPSRPGTDWQEYQQHFGGAKVVNHQWWISPNRQMNGLAFNYRW
jgi:hypothetical protein